jgi:hypothetical protein
MLREGEASTESKDPVPACSEMDLEGSSHEGVKCVVETPDTSLPKLRVSGSFDCVAARFAVGNFAQDDRHWVP